MTTSIFRSAALALTLLLKGAAGMAQTALPAHLPEKDIAALVNELSGEAAKQNLEGIARFHRQRASREREGEREREPPFRW